MYRILTGINVFKISCNSHGNNNKYFINHNNFVFVRIELFYICSAIMYFVSVEYKTVTIKKYKIRS